MLTLHKHKRERDRELPTPKKCVFTSVAIISIPVNLQYSDEYFAVV